MKPLDAATMRSTRHRPEPRDLLVAGALGMVVAYYVFRYLQDPTAIERLLFAVNVGAVALYLGVRHRSRDQEFGVLESLAPFAVILGIGMVAADMDLLVRMIHGRTREWWQPMGVNFVHAVLLVRMFWERRNETTGMGDASAEETLLSAAMKRDGTGAVSPDRV